MYKVYLACVYNEKDGVELDKKQGGEFKSIPGAIKWIHKHVKTYTHYKIYGSIK